MLLDVRLPLFNFLFACISRYSCNVTMTTIKHDTTSVPALAGIHVMLLKCKYKNGVQCSPALAGIHVMLRQMFIYCHYQLRSLKVAKPVLNEH